VNRFPDQFLPPVPASDREAWAWAQQEARRLPVAVLACLDPFTLRDRLAVYRQDPEGGALASVLLLRAVLDRVVAWQADRVPTRPEPERGQGGAER
jgi:hypothetical protein